MLETLRRLAAHLRWADGLVLDTLRAASVPPHEAVRIYVHLLAAEDTWLARLRGEAPNLAVWPDVTLAECEDIGRRNAHALDSFIATCTPASLERDVEYRNSAGRAFRTRTDDILLQMLLHGSYHRGQVALLLRQHGAEPPATDYIAFLRRTGSGTTG